MSDATSPEGGPGLALELAYDGTDFAGWQLQPDAPTVQGCVEDALAAVHGEPSGRVPIAGAGRTDAGVHALGQVASYRPPSLRSTEVLATALDALLPPSVRVLRVARVPRSFHACRSATGKTYRYRLVNRAILLPFERHYAWHVRIPLDVDAMRRAASPLVGRHDFVAFATAGGQSTSTVRHLRRLAIHELGGGVIEIEAAADGFLYHMVRNLAGLLVDVGKGRRAVSDTAEVLASRRRSRAGVTAPPQGLCLVRVHYPPESGF